ncbi:unnamed protein product [Vitrella brassicaformis CCMP3155]|uniref:MAPEG family protein n=2 Tax=Vitrella brassicaformis TaxID=1169539 RepID=A0A0G4EGZ5_VITBC|nr:unnamed protein product [Vitrella brassicaformis CCMP3155]|eukprot:CEL94870.1 unnamed protein product [Vitrella brassicaformis CCMP3155]
MALEASVVAPVLLFTVLNALENLALSFITAITRVKTGVLFGSGAAKADSEDGEAHVSRDTSLLLTQYSRAHGNHTEMIAVHLLLLLGLTLAASVEGVGYGLTELALYIYGGIFFVLRTMHTYALLRSDAFEKAHIFRPIGFVGNLTLMGAMAVHLFVGYLSAAGAI